ncbi:MAG: DUF488 family protein, N3 subclade [Bdellovibrionota bacterium]
MDDLKGGKLLRIPAREYVVVAMRIYPRFLKKNQLDEYLSELSPEPGLFAEYRNLVTEHDCHESAFELVNYEGRFDLSSGGKKQLERLSTLSQTCNVHLICRCKAEEHCHVDLVLLMAKHFFGVPVPPLPFRYQRFQARLMENKISGVDPSDA